MSLRIIHYIQGREYYKDILGGFIRHISKIVVHCTASPDYLDVGFKEINEWHKQRGWRSATGVSCGYHYVIRRNGEIERGRPDKDAGAHAFGVNATSIGVVWVGTDDMEGEQFEALINLLHFLMGKYNVTIEDVLGHKEAVKTDKTCPNINMDKVRAELIFVRPFPKVR